jgi:ribonuclease P protein component
VRDCLPEPELITPPATGGFRVLPPGHRLRLTRDHRRTVRHGVRGAGRLLVVHVLVPAGPVHDAPPRAGFVVGRTVGGAVARNTLRRRLRHLVHGRLDRFPPGSLVVVRAGAEAATASSATLGRDLDVALDRALATGARR